MVLGKSIFPPGGVKNLPAFSLGGGGSAIYILEFVPDLWGGRGVIFYNLTCMCVVAPDQVAT